MSKIKLINTSEYLLLIDEEAEIKKGDYLLEKESIINVFPNYLTDLTECNKIIAYRKLNKEAKELDLPLLPNPFEDDSVEEKAEKEFPKNDFIDNEILQVGFIKGYKAAQSKSKQFSLEDMKKAYYMGAANCHDKCIVHNWKGVEQKVDIDKLKILCQEYIQSLSTQQLPSEFIPEYEIVYEKNREFYGSGMFNKHSKKLKTITNSEGKQEIVGTYKY